MTQVHPLYLPLPFQDEADTGRLILRDGTTATLRVAASGDEEALHAFFERLSPESRYNRFFAAVVPRTEELARLCESNDPRQRLTLIVSRIVEEQERIIATASYFTMDDSSSAEVAFAVDDAFQGKGLGSLLLERLSILAARQGIISFIAITRAENRRMIELFRHSGFPLETEQEGTLVAVNFPILPNESSVAHSEMRDRVTTIASMRPFFHPRAVAVIGASRNPSSIGYRLVEALVMGHFQGAVYPVNPKGGVVCSIRAYSSVKALPERPDLAVIVAPRDSVLQVVDECAEQGVRALIVITAGFAEGEGEEGKRLQQQLVEKVRGYGMRMVGPNCLGLLNSDPEVQLNASFSPLAALPGRVAMASQSGALGLAILALTRQLGLGLSSFVSLGNKGDVSGNDLLQYWEEDERTNVILLYLESFGNPRRFARLAQRVSRRKPIIVVKSGRTLAGRRAAGSHTAALAASDVAVDALFRQSGVIRADTLDEMFHLATALSNQPLPRGRRVAVVTNAGGPGILCADVCEAGNLQLQELSPEIQGQLASFLPAAASVKNPVDLIASANPEQYQRCIETLLASEEIDALIVIYIPVGISASDDIREAIAAGVANARAAGHQEKTVLLCWMAGKEVGTPVPLMTPDGEAIPTYTFPEYAGRVMVKMSGYAAWRAQPPGIIPAFDDAQPLQAQSICRQALEARGPGWLTTEETRAVLAAMGLPIAPGGLARSAEEAATLSKQIGFPVVVKLASHEIVHKSDLGAVYLKLQDEAAVRQAVESIRDRLTSEGKLEAMEGVLVQPMLAGGIEVMIGMTEEANFGPLIAFGLGGIHVEILGDVCFRMTPLTQRDAGEMVREIRGYRLLQGYRGLPAVDVGALEETLLRLSRLVEEVPAIRELDMNPIFALPEGQGCSIVDARIWVAPGE